MLSLILASNSPRRKKILTDMELKYEVIPSNYDEKLDSDDFSYDKIEDIATQKCLDVVRRLGENNNSPLSLPSPVLTDTLSHQINAVGEGKAINDISPSPAGRGEQSNSLVLAADTVVVLHNKILGKPHTKENAFKMLKELSGNTHMVVTSICAINTKTNRAVTMSTTSYVRFTEWTDDMIHHYIDEFNPLDKAGSYGIQELPDGYLDKYEGSFENIVGLSPESVTTVLNQLNYNPQ